MNTYAKYCQNVFVAKCEEPQEKGTEITMTTKYGSEHEVIVFNHLLTKDGFHYYSVVRSDGFNAQEHAKRKAEKLNNAAANAEKKSHSYWQASQEGKDFLVLAEPIKIGHHSEKRHRALIERNWNRMGKSVEYSNKAESYSDRVSYWENKANTINLSMPESIEYYEFKLEKAKLEHEAIKSGKQQRQHSFDLPYAKKAVNEAQKNLDLAIKLWGDVSE